jgi:hypothetical protein
MPAAVMMAYFIEGQSVSEHPYPVVVRGKGQTTTIEQPDTRNSVPVTPSAHWETWEHICETYQTPTKSIVTGVQKVRL